MNKAELMERLEQILEHMKQGGDMAAMTDLDDLLDELEEMEGFEQ